MVRYPLRALFLVIALLTLFASTASALDLGGHDRDGTVFGLTLGYGWNSIDYTPEIGNARTSGTFDTFTGGARIGWAPSDFIIGSLGFYGWRSTITTLTPSSASNYALMLEAYVFPKGEGFWVKGGLGWGTIDFSVTAALPINNIVFNESGLAWSTGAGYEFRVSDGTAVGICYDLLYIPVGDFAGFTDTSSLSQSVSLNLHFYFE